MSSDNLRSAASAYAAQGWSVFPCVKLGKRPATTRGFHDATADVEAVDAIWGAIDSEANIGLALGASGLFAVDIEVADHPLVERLPSTWTQRTPGGGWHFLYRDPRVGGVPLRSRKLEWAGDTLLVEVKADGGYVLLAPSMAMSDKVGRVGRYEVVNDVPVADAPEWLVDMLRARDVRDERAGDRTFGAVTGDGRERVGQLCQELRSARKGERNERLISIAASVGRVVAGGGISESEAEAALWMAVAPWGNPRKDHACIRRGLAFGQTCAPWVPFEAREAPFDAGAVAQMLAELGVGVADEGEGEPEKTQAPTGDVEAHEGETAPGVGGLSMVVAPEHMDASKQNTNETQSTEARPTLDAQAESLWAAFSRLNRFCALYAAELEERVEYRQPGLMLASAVATLGALAMRRWAFDGVTSSMMICSLAPTATGKGAPQAFADSVLAPWQDLIGPGDFSSSVSFGERMHKATLDGHGLLFVVDEYGPVLRILLNDRNLSQAGLRPMLLKMSQINAGTLKLSTSMARGGEDKVFHAPSLVVWGSTTPESLHEALSPMALADGFGGRHLWFTAASRLPRWNRAQHRGPVSSALLGIVTAARASWSQWFQALPKDASGATLYRADEVRCTAEAQAVFDAHREKCDAERRKASTDTGREALLGRQVEHAKRVALSLACIGCIGADGAEGTPEVTETYASFACSLVQYSTDVVCASIALNGAGSDRWEQQLGRVRRAWARLVARGQTPSRSAMLRATQLRAAELDEAEQWLVDAGEIPRRGPVKDASPADMHAARPGLVRRTR